MADESLIRLLEQQTQLMRTMETQMELMQQHITRMSAPSSDAAVGSTLKSSVSVPWPQPLEVETGDPYENMEFFRNRWENYCIATGMNNWGPEKDEIKAGILLNAIGNAAMKKYMDFNLSERDKKKEKSIFIKIEEEIIKKTNIVHSRYVFNIRGQNTDENFDDFLLSLRKLIKPCHYPDTIKEEMLRDRIVVGIRDSKVMSELLRNENLTLDVAINICHSAERASAHVSDLQKVNEVNKISKHVKKEATEWTMEYKSEGDMTSISDNH